MQHIAFICDGHRRWADSHNVSFYDAYNAGVDVLTKIATHAFSKKIPYLTFYVLSSENTNRSQEWLAIYEAVLNERLDACFEIARKNEARIVFLGEKDVFSIGDRLRDIEEKTRHYDNGQLNLAFNYGGRAEILRAARLMCHARACPEDPAPLDPLHKAEDDSFTRHLYTANIPDPDFLIRTSGEYRLSNFFLWQCAYTELYFIEKHFPDFTNDDLDLAIAEYHKRQRRRGL